MRLSKTYAVPDELALLYDFVNSLDCRCYMEGGVAHTPGDALERATQFRKWLEAHALASKLGEDAHRKALALRSALRAYLKLDPHDRFEAATARALSDAASAYPLVAFASAAGVELRAENAGDQLGALVLAQLHRLATSGEIGRLRMCASEECQWIFFDRSKPGNRRWCSSARCGNRQKTRSYRERRRFSGSS